MTFLAQIKGWMVAAASAVMFVVSAYLLGRRDAKKSAELDNLKSQKKDREIKDEAVQRVDVLGDDAVRQLAIDRMRREQGAK